MLEHFPEDVKAVSISETIGNTSVKKGTKEIDLSITGISRGYFMANDITMLAGNKFSQSESASAKNVVLVADTFVEDYWGQTPKSILGKELEVQINSQNVTYTVAKVYEYEESVFASSDATTCYIPLTTAQSFNHSKNYSSVSVVSNIGVDSDNLAVKIENYLNGYYRSNEYFDRNLTKQEREEYLDIIAAESERLSELATNVLELTKLEKQTILTG